MLDKRGRSFGDPGSGSMTQKEQQNISKFYKRRRWKKQSPRKVQKEKSSEGRKFHQLDSSIRKQVVTHQRIFWTWSETLHLEFCFNVCVPARDSNLGLLYFIWRKFINVSLLAPEYAQRVRWWKIASHKERKQKDGEGKTITRLEAAGMIIDIEFWEKIWTLCKIFFIVKEQGVYFHSTFTPQKRKYWGFVFKKGFNFKLQLQNQRDKTMFTYFSSFVTQFKRARFK